MNNNSRTAKAIKNSTISLISQICFLLVSFTCRTIFTYLLGAQYLGINGLFSNILVMLSFAELGVGSALVYRMYEPLATGNMQKLAAYVNLYKKIYRWVMAVIAFLGILIIPFLPYLVHAPQVHESLTLLYLLYLLDTIVSYMYVYKKSILIADQKDYIVSIYSQVFNIIAHVLQIIFLLLTHNFVIYCLIRTGGVLLNNIACSRKADKIYRSLQTTNPEPLSNKEISQLKTDVKGLLLTKVASVTFSGTDNLFISAFIGIQYVGILSNYTLLLTTFNGMMNRVFSSITASVGNLAVTGTSEQMEKILKKMFFLNTAIYGYVCIGIVLLIQQFVTQIWLTPEYTLSQTIIFLMIFELFLRSIHYPLYTTRMAMGCFSQHRIWFAVMAVINIILDFMWVKPYGIAGLFVATILCRGTIYFIDLWVVYHEQWKISIWNYLKPMGFWIIFLLSITWFINKSLYLISYSGYVGFILKILLVTLLYVLFVLVVFGRSEEFAYYKKMAYKLLCKGKGI